MAEQEQKDTSEIYEIKIHGQLDVKWSEWFYDLAITHDGDVTTLRGPLPDQTVLHSVLDRIRDMNLPLISVNQIAPDGKTTNCEVKGAGQEDNHSISQ